MLLRYRIIFVILLFSFAGLLIQPLSADAFADPLTLFHTTFVDSFSVAAQAPQAADVAFSSDGTKMFVLARGVGDAVNEYTLSTPFVVSTSTFVDSFLVEEQDTNPRELAFSPDGTKMFVLGGSGQDVNEYTLSTPFDVSTSTFVDSFSVAGEEVYPEGLAFSSDGRKMFVVGLAGIDVNEYLLLTPFDVSTSFFVDSFSVAGEEIGPFGVRFSSDGTKMFVLGGDGQDTIHEYILSTGFDVSTATFVGTFSVAGQEENPLGFAFSSDGTKMFVLGDDGQDVNEYTLDTPFALFHTYFIDSFSVAGQESEPTGVAFSPDGTKMFVVGSFGDDVYEYTLDTPFVVSTSTFVDSFSVAAQETFPQGLAFSSDGAKMFVVGSIGDDVNEYTLSTPFDVSTATFVDSFSVAGQEANPQGVAFSSDGAKMFVVGSAGDDVNEYTLTTAFDVSTASFVDSFSVAAQETAPRDVVFSSNGAKMFVAGFDGIDINEYTLSTPFDVSTSTFVDSFSVAGQDTILRGVAFSSNGAKMFVVGATGDAVYEYTLDTPFALFHTYFIDSFSVAGQDFSPQDVAFSPDGTKMFVVGSFGPDVYEYTLDTPFDVSTSTFIDSFSVAGQEAGPTGVAFSSDGTKMFVVGGIGDAVNEYILFPEFDVSTVAFVDSFSVAGQEAAPTDVAFSSDGTKMFVVGGVGADVNEYTLDTPFDVSTSTFVDSFSVAEDTTPMGVAFSSDGTKMFVVGSIGAGTGADVYEYTLDTPFDVSTSTFVDSFSVAGQEAAPTGVAFSSDGTKMFVVGGIGIDVSEYKIVSTLSCSPPPSGNWMPTTSCILESSEIAPANVIIQSGVVLTIPSGLSLDIDFATYALHVNSGGGVLVKLGGTIT